jgi:hypothetical protein
MLVDGSYYYRNYGGIMRDARVWILAAGLVILGATPAFADLTGFIGATTTPANRPVKGLAIGIGVLVVGFEFEYAGTSEDEDEDAPALRTGVANALLQTPVPIAGVQPYLTAGVGLFRERLGTHQETGLAMNSGGGVKISLIGPLRLRVDYRVFQFNDDALHSPVHRVYAGLNLRF